MSFGGIPLLYYGDAVGTLNNDGYLQDSSKMDDNRWVHRPTIDWEVMARRNEPGSVEQRIFSQMKQMIAVRKEISAFADLNNRELIDMVNPHLFAFNRYVQTGMNPKVVVVANFDVHPQRVELHLFKQKGLKTDGTLIDLCSGQTVQIEEDAIILPKLTAYWLPA